MTRQKFEHIVEYIKGLIKGSEFENHCFVVGGAVRDLVMENEIKDIDIVIDLRDGGIVFAEWMKENGYTDGSIVTYPTYGTAMFRLKEFPEIEIECVQTRKEQYKDENSRNPETEYGTIFEDAMRRDLTINALFLNVSTGEIIDPTEKGFDDIKEHVIRVTSDPDIVFFDDGLRLMRVCRFACKLGWKIEDNTYGGMCRNAYRLVTITKERVADELSKILMTDNAANGIMMLHSVGLLQHVIPELCETVEMTQNRFHDSTVFGHTLKVLDLVVKRPYWGVSHLETRMAALLHDIGKVETRTVDEMGNVHFYGHENKSADMIDTILRRLKYPNNFIERVKFLSKNHMRTKQWGDNCEHMKEKTLRKLQYECGYARFFELMTLIDADNKAHADGYCLPNQVYNICKKTNEMVENRSDMFDYVLPINGDDVMEVKGLKPCEAVGKCIEYAMKLAFNCPNITKEKLLKHIKGYKV